MSMSSIPSSSQSGKLYGWVERIGNKVPHPFLLFIYLIIVLMVTTAIFRPLASVRKTRPMVRRWS